MKILRLSTIVPCLFLFATGCAYLDHGPGTVTGQEARAIIADRLQINLVIFMAGSTSTSNQLAQSARLGAIITERTPDTIVVDEKATYRASEVEACADEAFKVAFFVSAALGPIVCRAERPSIRIPLVNHQL